MCHPNASDRQRLKRFIINVVAVTVKAGGATARLETYQLLAPSDTWGFPKYPSKTVILPPDADLAPELELFIKRNSSYLKEPDCCLGTWTNPRTKHYYLDISTSRDNLASACQVARAISAREGRKIVALYNAKLERTVYL